MQDSPQHLTTTSGPRETSGGSSANAPSRASRSAPPEQVGHRFGRLMVIHAEPIRKGWKRLLRVRCTTCGAEGTRDRSALRAGNAGCRTCGNPRQVPKWLYQRARAAQRRCTSPNDKAFARYGGRGIEFGFASPMAMALWVQEHLGLHQDMEIDRIDNDRHYEPGNLRYMTRRQNLANTRKTRVAPLVHALKLEHPEITYADTTLSHLFGRGLTADEIVERFHQPSCKPKGVYGTSSTPDPVIASLAKGS